jgi:hypothetical protein
VGATRGAVASGQPREGVPRRRVPRLHADRCHAADGRVVRGLVPRVARAPGVRRDRAARGPPTARPARPSSSDCSASSGCWC